MRPGVLCAVPGRAEADLVAALDAPGTGLHVVRRCADLAEVVAAALAGLARLAVLGTGLAGVDRAAVARLREAGVRVVLLAEPADADRARALGAEAVLTADARVADVVVALRAVADADRGGQPGPAPRPGDAPMPSERRPGDAAPASTPEVGRTGPAATEEGDAEPAAPRGRLVAVWGPHGSPGRTTLAIALAAELAALGEQALVVDADTWGGCVGQSLGLLDESPGLAAAVRQAAGGGLDAISLAALCPVVEPGLRVLTGLTRPDRWRELSPTALDTVWEVAREVAGWTVVDCGFSVEDDGGAGFEAMLGPRRNGATLSALAAADVLVAVGSGEPVGIQRLVQGLADLADADVVGPEAQRVVVVTRVRASAAGPRPEQAVTEALVRYAGIPVPVVIPDDRPAYDRAMLAGVTLRAAAPASPARLAVADLARQLRGGSETRRTRRRRARVRGPRAGRR